MVRSGEISGYIFKITKHNNYNRFQWGMKGGEELKSFGLSNDEN